ncbi:MAG: hypothetical protein A3K19_32690 [Lentisphaerae bacterium RIFOXYB12_FULL_65_16]|nr:MAG: hypothetical protein A3K18_07875 [Lentisphaerae bacterium RIFOXYA12_64_32]OGV84454.1 MAG: hypothetical protein A3K19_32690 [Lentisphaerae bacterium RIFOXYB12_FULL_65_16]
MRRTKKDPKPQNTSLGLADIDQEIHIASLKRQIEDMSGVSFTPPGRRLDPTLEAAFLERVLAFETAPRGTHFAELTRTGVVMPGPDSMTDAEIAAKLTEIVTKLAERRVFLYSTNHLSDRELYTLLVTRVFHEETTLMPPDPDSACHLDLLGGCSDADTRIWLKYYADDEERDRWRRDFPEDPIPAHEDPPYHRDASLPQREY